MLLTFNLYEDQSRERIGHRKYQSAKKKSHLMDINPEIRQVDGLRKLKKETTKI